MLLCNDICYNSEEYSISFVMCYLWTEHIKQEVFLCVVSRSLCSLVCAWMYQADCERSEWDVSFFREVGLDDLLLENCSKIGVSYFCLLELTNSDIFGSLTFTQTQNGIYQPHHIGAEQ